MDDSAIKRRLQTLVPADLDGARERAKLAARVRLSRASAPTASRLGNRRLLRRRNFALAGAVAAVAAGILIAIGSGGGSAVRPAVADAAELTQLGAVTPHLQLLKEWQIVNTEVSPDGGTIQFRFEGPEGVKGVPASGESEIQWHSASPAERGEQLEAEGFAFAGPKPMVIGNPHALATGDYEHALDEKSAQVYVSHEDGQESFDAAGLWEEGGMTLEFRADVPDFYTLERLMERIEVLNDEEWLVALQPGGGTWLAETGSGTIEKVEKIRVGEKPDGEPIYSERGFFGASEQGEGLSNRLRESFPTIYREGDTTRTVINQPPPAVAEH
jgi:hypothetical protein